MDLWDWLDWLVRTVTVDTLVKVGEPEDGLKLQALKPLTDRETAVAASDMVATLMPRYEDDWKNLSAKDRKANEFGYYWPFFVLRRVQRALATSTGPWWRSLPSEMQEAASSALSLRVETDPINYAALVIQASGWDHTHRLLMDTARSIAELNPLANEQALALVTGGWFDNRGFTLDALIATATATVSGT
jgi:hypothetical protein